MPFQFRWVALILYVRVMACLSSANVSVELGDDLVKSIFTLLLSAVKGKLGEK